MVEIAKNRHEVLAMSLKELRKKLRPVQEFLTRELTLEFERKKTKGHRRKVRVESYRTCLRLTQERPSLFLHPCRGHRRS